MDIDAVAGWLGSYGGEDSTSDISRGKSGDELTEHDLPQDSDSEQGSGPARLELVDF